MTGPIIAGWRKRILVADDAASGRELLRSILEACDYDIEEAEDGEQVLASIGAFGPDLVILGLSLPKMDGYATAAALRQMPGLARLPILALTAAITQTAPDKLAEAGFSAFLVKPVGPARLRKCVASLL